VIQDVLGNLGAGFGLVLTPSVLVYAVIGCILGTLVGVLPGVGPLSGMSVLLPIAIGLDPVRSLILLSGIFYGSMYGGSTTSILMNIPGEAASVVTCLDGYALARKGRAGAALAIAALGSFVAGTFGVIVLMVLAPTLGRFALRFGPPEYAALLVFGLAVLSYMSLGSMPRSLAMIVLGMLLGMVGIDRMTGYLRFDHGLAELGDGLGVVPVAVGLFGMGELLATAGEDRRPEVLRPRIRDLLPTAEELRRSVKPIARGSLLGFGVGLLPGPAHIVSTFLSYAVERRFSRNPDEFGRGAIEGVAGPESANNAATTGALVPMLSLGIPPGPATAMMMAAIMVHGVSPGPLLIKEQPALFWGFVASMYVGNLVLLILNLPLVGLFVNILRIPYAWLYPIIFLFCVIGVYANAGSVVDLWIMVAMGVVGYVLRRLDFELAPIVLGLVLAPLLEVAWRQSLIMSGGSYGIFVTRPIAAALLGATGLLLAVSVGGRGRRRVGWRQRALTGGTEESSTLNPEVP